jgi:ParB family chromosome partitioning protein
MTELLMIPLNKLRHGSDPEAGVAINARVTNKTEGANVIAASMRAIMSRIKDHSGIVVPLAVASGPKDHYFVIAGGVRLAALHLLLKDKTIRPDHAVPAIVHGDAKVMNEIALEMSIIENAQRNPLHPIDEYEAYAVIEAAMAAEGRTEAEIVTHIAVAFTISERTVRQRLALGRSLSKHVREAWRDGRVSTASAKVFTLAADHKTQDKVLEALDDPGDSHAVKNALGLDTPADAQRFIQFIGADAYRAAGGTVTEDLFGMDHQIDDPALAKRLADERLEWQCSHICTDEHWAWAAIADKSPGWQGWPRVYSNGKPTKDQQTALDDFVARLETLDEESDEAEAVTNALERLQVSIEMSGFTAKQRKAAGCVVYIGNNGQLQIVRGVQRPAAELKGKTADQNIVDDPHAPEPAPAATKQPGDAPQSLVTALNTVLTRAAAHALDADPALALSAFLAAAVTTGGVLPVRIHAHGIAGRSDTFPARYRGASDGFMKVLKRINAMDAKHRASLVTLVVADSLNMLGGLADEDIAGFANALPAKAMNAELRRLFDRKAYFESISNSIRAYVVESCIGKDAADKVLKMSKAEAVKFCLANVDKKWLPPQLRTRHYDGPRAKPARK